MVLAVVGLAGIWAAPLVTLISAIVTAIYCRRIRAGWDK